MNLISKCLSSFVLALLATVLFSGCNVKEKSAVPSEKFVLSTTAMLDDIVGCIVKDKLDHQVLIQGDMDPHSYELVKGDHEKVFASQILFYNGLGLEHGASIAEAIKKHPHSVNIGEYIYGKNSSVIITTEHQLDPHIWMDMEIWSQGIEKVVDSLIALMPEWADFFREGAKECRQNMLRVNHEIEMLLAEIPEEKRYLVTSHDAFHYFARRYLATEQERQDGTWRNRSAAPEGLAPEGQLSVADIQWIIDYVIDHNIKVLFLESNVSQDPLMKVADSLRKKKYKIEISKKPLYGDAIGNTDESNTYIKMMQSNGKNLHDAWK